MAYSRNQRLRDWVEMLHRIYGNTQNYSKSPFEIYSHLTEVTGAFGKQLLKKRDPAAALDFLPRMFGWAVALYIKVKGASGDMEEAILIKYPRSCSYCQESPCKCWGGEKPQVKEGLARDRYFAEAGKQDRTLNGFQLMMRNIYSQSWGLDQDVPGKDDWADVLRMYARTVEELAEVGEAMRFHHLYPSNFNNEFADYIAWWFALVTNIHRVMPEGAPQFLVEDVLWPAYPGFCTSCGLVPCDCRPGPVRELLSKPSLIDLAFIDGLTQAQNRAAFDRSVSDIKNEHYPIALPLACIRVDVDNFKSINDELSHSAGDAALTTIVTILRRKARSRDKVFRVGGDEFALLCPDFSAREAEGMMTRVANAIKDSPIRGLDAKGAHIEKVITLSIGIAGCSHINEVETSLEKADKAAMKSKAEGKDRITIAD